MAIKKGIFNESEVREFNDIFDSLSLKFKLRNIDKRKGFRASIYYVLEEAREWKRRHQTAMAILPKRFDEFYDRGCYRVDVRHIYKYYSRFQLEDLWECRKVLRRIRRFEKREGLKPFEVVQGEEKKKERYRRELEKNGGTIV